MVSFVLWRKDFLFQLPYVLEEYIRQWNGLIQCFPRVFRYRLLDTHCMPCWHYLYINNRSFMTKA